MGCTAAVVCLGVRGASLGQAVIKGDVSMTSDGDPTEHDGELIITIQTDFDGPGRVQHVRRDLCSKLRRLL